MEIDSFHRAATNSAHRNVVHTMPSFNIANETFWEKLLDKIKDGRVIPVIGTGVTRVNLGNAEQPLEAVIADKLAVRLGLNDGNGDLHSVVARIHRRDPYEDAHDEVHNTLRSLGQITIPETLRVLAGIESFDLFITLTFDDLLYRAIIDARRLAPSDCLHIGYAPNLRREDKDLPVANGKPCVYALFGKECSAQEFVISDDDLLEWITALQDPDNRPQRLFDRLRSNHLLFLGCALPDWLVRFFMRMGREGRVSATRANETLIGSGMHDQSRLVAFLDHFSPRTTFLDADPAQFISELAERWTALSRTAPPSPLTGLPPDLHDGGIFLSYASDDKNSVLRLRDELQSNTFDIWLDTDRLHSGAEYDKVIARNIGRCGVFIAVISLAALNRLRLWRDEDGHHPDKKPYFLKEWELALARTGLEPDSLRVFPIRVDTSDLHNDLIPSDLRRLTCDFLQDGTANAAFLTHLKEAVREQRKKREGKS